MKLGWGLGYNFRCDCCCKVFVINCSEWELMRLSRWSVDIFTVKSVEEELTSWQQELQRDPSLGTLWVSRKKIFNYRWGSRLIKSKISVWSFPYEKPLSSIIEMLITKAKKPSQLFPYNLNQEPTNPWFGTVRHDRKVPLNKKKTNFVSPLIFIFAAVMTFTYSSEEIQWQWQVVLFSQIKI